MKFPVERGVQLIVCGAPGPMWHRYHGSQLLRQRVCCGADHTFAIARGLTEEREKHKPTWASQVNIVRAGLSMVGVLAPPFFSRTRKGSLIAEPLLQPLRLHLERFRSFGKGSRGAEAAFHMLLSIPRPVKSICRPAWCVTRSDSIPGGVSPP